MFIILKSLNQILCPNRCKNFTSVPIPIASQNVSVLKFQLFYHTYKWDWTIHLTNLNRVCRVNYPNTIHISIVNKWNHFIGVRYAIFLLKFLFINIGSILLPFVLNVYRFMCEMFYPIKTQHLSSICLWIYGGNGRPLAKLNW